MHDNLLARSDGVPSAVDFLLGTRDEREQREQLLRAPEARVEVAARLDLLAQQDAPAALRTFSLHELIHVRCSCPSAGSKALFDRLCISSATSPRLHELN